MIFMIFSALCHCRFALFPHSFTVQGFVPSAAETDRVLLTTYAHPVLLTLRLPAFLFLCHIHLAQAVVLESHLSCINSHPYTQRQHTEQGFYLTNSVRCSLVLYKPQLMYSWSCYMYAAQILSKLAPWRACSMFVVSCVMFNVLNFLCLSSVLSLVMLVVVWFVVGCEVVNEKWAVSFHPSSDSLQPTCWIREYFLALFLQLNNKAG